MKKEIKTALICILLCIDLDVLYYDIGFYSILKGYDLFAFGKYSIVAKRAGFKEFILAKNGVCLLFNLIFVALCLIKTKKKDK